jgi:ribonucleoside-diphosphate reductase alpha chain
MADLEVIKRSGTKDKLDITKLERALDRELEGIPHVDKAKLLESVKSNIYGGMSTKDLQDVLILSATSFFEEAPEYDTVAARFLLKKLFKEVTGEAAYDETTYRNAFIQNIKRGVKKGVLDERLLDFDLDKLAGKLVVGRDALLKYMGLQTLYERYFVKMEGKRIELPQAFWMRVAMGISLLENNKEDKAIEFYNTISQLHAVPSTPTLFHSGLTHPQLASCYLNYVSDDLHHIFKVFGDNAQLSKFSGGIGTDWTAVRSTGAMINTTNVESQGIIPFIKIQNDTTVAISRSGKRRGASCAYCEAWHLDIEDFIDLKKSTGDDRRRAHDLSTAVWVPDLFMQRVERDESWTLFSPDEAPHLHETYGSNFKAEYEKLEQRADAGAVKLFKRIKAKKLWQKIITSLFETGHPWITWKDPCNVRSAQKNIGPIHSSNLCTEIIEHTSPKETSVCTLLSVNLEKMVEDGKINWGKLSSTIYTTVRMLDNTIDICYYPTKEARTSHLQHRPLGLGHMGWQDMLFKLNIDFDSDEAVALADKINEFISWHAIASSTILSAEKGSYESFAGSLWQEGILPIDTLSLLERERGGSIQVNRNVTMDWARLRERVRKGMRNSLLTAIAPTATISNIAGCFPSFEAIFSNIYVKANMTGEFTIINQYLVEDLRKLGLWDKDMIHKIKLGNGSIQDISLIPARLRSKYKTAFEVDPKRAIQQTAVRGKWICQSQSHNIFFAGKSGKAISDIYFDAWHSGLKTTYYLRTTSATQIEKATCSLDNPECTSCQ